jgi:selenocysteine-specific elongation factor
MHIIGTAGHVDHGKSSLVRALTGTDPDRWAEEQRRGMTLDLGFAHLTLDDGSEAGIIDVPGHERFLHNMLAGAAGMELVLLVIAANEGPMPQTLEHLAILGYLNARGSIVVLTKSDTVDAAELAAVRARVAAQLAGTLADGAPIAAVSTLTGDGLSELRAAIGTALSALPPRSPNAPAYLPIDRVFARSGHGTVITGTLMQGQVGVGDTLLLSPLGRRVRVRGLQVFGRKRERVAGGTRVAINVPGVETTDIARGAVLASPQFVPATSFEVRFRALPAARELIRRRTPVRAYVGSAEILGTLVFAHAAQSSDSVAARLHLRTAAVVFPGEPFVVRRVSPMDLLGGGTIVAPAAATADDAAAPAAPRGGATAPGDTTGERERAAILAAIGTAGIAGATPAQISAAANVALARVEAVLPELVTDGRVRTLSKPVAFVAADAVNDLLARTLAHLRQRQHERPWLMGVTSLALAQTFGSPEPGLIRALAVCVEAGLLAYRGGYYATTDFTPHLGAEQTAFFDRVFAAGAAPPAPVPVEELRALIRSAAVPELGAAYETLVASGALVKVGEFVYRGSHLATIRAQLEAALRAQGRITVADFRTLTGTSRKYAVPLLEFFDATGVTLRTGDVRVLRRTTARV